MKLKITRDTVFEGKRVKKGDVVESKSKLLVQIGKAEIVDGKKSIDSSPSNKKVNQVEKR